MPAPLRNGSFRLRRGPVAPLRAALAALVVLSAAALARPASASQAEPCTLAGRWAVRYAVPLSWRFNAGVEGGVGDLILTARVDRVATGAHTYVDTVHLCSRRMPTTRSLAFYGGERYASRLDETLLAAGAMPPAQAQLHVQADGGGFVTTPFALLYGLAAEDAAAAFPKRLADARALATDVGARGRPGMRMVPVTSDELRLPPVNARRSRRATSFDVIGRDVLQSRGEVRSCDLLLGQLEFAQFDDVPALQAMVVGCAVEDGSDCTSTELSIINRFAPSFRPSLGSVTMARVADDADCADVHALLP